MWGDGEFVGPSVKFVPIITNHHGGNTSTEQLKCLMPVVTNHIAMNDRKASINITGESIK